MTLLDRFEKRFGRYAVENVTLVLIAGQVLIFAAQFFQPGGAGDLTSRLQLDPDKVLEGEVWRLFTFMFIAPLSQWPILVIFFWYLLYLMGSALEQAWSVFKFNVYCGLSYFATVAAAFIAQAITPGPGNSVADFLYGSIFLAFARLYPDFRFMLFFVLPVKVKWLATFQWLLYGLVFAGALSSGDWFTLLTISAAVSNFLLFFGGDIWGDIKHGHRRTQWRAKALKSNQRMDHECRVCGLTRETAPKTAFRYCSQCAGQCCYCPDHIHNHEHVLEEEPAEARR